jgi:hypothetical protein
MSESFAAGSRDPTRPAAPPAPPGRRWTTHPRCQAPRISRPTAINDLQNASHYI